MGSCALLQRGPLCWRIVLFPGSMKQCGKERGEGKERGRRGGQRGKHGRGVAHEWPERFLQPARIQLELVEAAPAERTAAYALNPRLACAEEGGLGERERGREGERAEVEEVHHMRGEGPTGFTPSNVYSQVPD